MELIFYRGKSLISRAIRFRTWGPYSHVGHLLSDGRVIEAWAGGVRCVMCAADQHQKNTRVDIFSVPSMCAEEARRARISAEARIGTPYDYWAILGFLLRLHIDQRASLFCSEMVFLDYQRAGIQLLTNIRADQVSPTLLSYSPLLRYERSCLLRRKLRI